jgi:hypothetical protein
MCSAQEHIIEHARGDVSLLPSSCRQTSASRHQTVPVLMANAMRRDLMSNNISGTLPKEWSAMNHML